MSHVSPCKSTVLQLCREKFTCCLLEVCYYCSAFYTFCCLLISYPDYSRGFLWDLPCYREQMIRFWALFSRFGGSVFPLIVASIAMANSSVDMWPILASFSCFITVLYYDTETVWITLLRTRRLLPKLNAPVAISKSMWARMLCSNSNKILQFLTGLLTNTSRLYNGHTIHMYNGWKMVVSCDCVRLCIRKGPWNLMQVI